MRIGRLALLAAVLMTSGVAQAATSDSLPQTSDVPGFGVMQPTAADNNLLAATLGTRHGVSIVAFGAHGIRLVFGLRSTSVATAARLTRRHRGDHGLAIGQGGYVHVDRRGGAIQLVFRIGGEVEAVRLTAALPASTRINAAIAYAQDAAARLRRTARETPYQRALDGIRPDGRVPLTTALELFSLAFEPLPGVRLPPGRQADAISTTAAELVIRADWKLLTPAQRAVAARALYVPLPPGSRPKSRAIEPFALTPAPDLQAIAEAWATTYTTRLSGHVLGLKIFVYRDSTPYKNASAGASLLNADGSQGTGTPTWCMIRVFPKGQAKSDIVLRLILAHEVFHCFEFDLMPAWQKEGFWILEGMADWAAVTVDPLEEIIAGRNLRTYYANPEASLFARSYDAIGFWGRVDEAFGAGSLWAKIPGILQPASNQASFDASGAAAPAFLDLWSSGMVRFTYLDGSWRQRLPFDDTAFLVAPTIAPVVSSTPLATASWQTRDFSIQPDASLPIVAVTKKQGSLRLDFASNDLGPDTVRWFCMSGTCTCPPGQQLVAPSLTLTNNQEVLVALSGGDAPSRATVTYEPLAKFCKRAPTPPGTHPGGGYGDPHLFTFDGLYYDFQGAGEFWLVRSTSGDLAIQARAQPVSGRNVTWITQLGVSLSGHRLDLLPGNGLRVFLDGAPLTLPVNAPQPVGSGVIDGNLAAGFVQVTWPDGSYATIVSYGASLAALGIDVSLAHGRAGGVAGLLGNNDGNPLNDLPGVPFTIESSFGQTDVANPTDLHYFDALYPRFADRWRITQHDSLLRYEPGQTTATFTIRHFPKRPVSDGQLPGASRAHARAICEAAGVTEPAFLESCIIDAVESGFDPSVAAIDAEQQAASHAQWRSLQAGANLTQPVELARTPDGVLHAVYAERFPGGATAMEDNRIGADGRELGPPVLISTYDGAPSPFVTSAGNLAIDAGVIPPVEHSGDYLWTSSPPWTSFTEVGPITTVLGYGPPTHSTSGPGGVVFSVTSDARVFRGLNATNPGVTLTGPGTGCVSFDPAIASDAVTVWAAYVRGLCQDPANDGLYAAQIDPATGIPGPAILIPQSSWSGGSFEPFGAIRVQLVSRPGGGVYVAYATPAAHGGSRVLVYRLGASGAPVTVAVTRHAATTILTSPEPTSGRLWVTWLDGSLYAAARSDPAVTSFSSPTLFGRPAGSRLSTIPTLAINAGNGSLDAVYATPADAFGGVRGASWITRIRG